AVRSHWPSPLLRSREYASTPVASDTVLGPPRFHPSFARSRMRVVEWHQDRFSSQPATAAKQGWRRAPRTRRNTPSPSPGGLKGRRHPLPVLPSYAVAVLRAPIASFRSSLSSLPPM